LDYGVLTGATSSYYGGLFAASLAAFFAASAAAGSAGFLSVGLKSAANS